MTFNINEHKWGGSGIEKELFLFIKDNFKENSIVVELGGGFCSTPALSSLYQLYTVEQSEKFISDNVNTSWIHAPIDSTGWYSADKVRQGLPKKYDLLFVDGPAGEGNRYGILDNLDVIPEGCKIILHDTYREPERDLSRKLAMQLGMDIKFYEDGDFWAVLS